MATSDKGILLVQKPVIKHSLVEIGKSVTDRITELNVENLVATDDTIQSLKSLRADLNKELDEYEGQRKDIKNAIASPYNDFELVYKDEVSNKYKSAIDILKNKIGEFEDKVKKEKKDKIQSYFAELCLDAEIDFVKFSDTGININLSTSEKKYKEDCQAFVRKVQDDLALIKTTEFEAEIMTEYKKTLNASKAITEVNSRKEAERREAERIKFEETQKRVTRLIKLAFVHNTMVNCYYWVSDDSVMIEMKEIENLSKDDFERRFLELESEVKSKSKPVVTEEQTTKETTQSAQPLKAPKVVDSPELKSKMVMAKFECTGTLAQLKALGQYMKDNGITYKNL